MQKTWVDPWVRKILWRRKWHPTPVFLSGKSHGQRTLAGYSGVTKGRTQLSDWGHTHQNQDKDHRGLGPLGAAYGLPQWLRCLIICLKYRRHGFDPWICKLPISAGSLKKQEFQKNIYFCFIDYTKAFDCVDNNKLWKILKEMGIPDHLTCLLRNLYAGQEAAVRTGHRITDWFQTGKGVRQGCILSPCLFNLYAEYIMRNAGLEEEQLESRLLGEISITSDMQMTPPL